MTPIPWFLGLALAAFAALVVAMNWSTALGSFFGRKASMVPVLGPAAGAAAFWILPHAPGRPAWIPAVPLLVDPASWMLALAALALAHRALQRGEPPPV